MFKLSRAAEYAVRGIIYIASQKGDEAIHLKDIAKNQKVPEYFLVKIISRLVRSGLVTSSRGKGGGVRLAKPAVEISVYDVITAVEGPVELNDCIICKNSKKCKMKPIWDEAKLKMVEVLEAHKVADIAQSKK